jgi:predicted NAD-dependent protein-ADP-ribosyltransferase YbiA (DUF1768 family)
LKTAKQKSRNPVLSQNQIDNWEIVKMEKMEEIAIEKYKQCQYAYKILKLTGDAKLVHYTRGGSVHFSHLERIRDEYI